MSTEPATAQNVPVSDRKTIYPQPFAARVAGRRKRRIGDYFGLTNFGVNLTELEPGAVSALVHHHSKQDEFIFVMSGHPTLVLGDREYQLSPGDCCGFKAGTGVGHHLANRSADPVRYLEIGDRTPGDLAAYPHDDLILEPAPDGSWLAKHRDGMPY